MNNRINAHDIARAPKKSERRAARLLSALLLMIFAPFSALIINIHLNKGGSVFDGVSLVFGGITLVLAVIYIRASSKAKSRKLSPNGIVIVGIVVASIALWLQPKMSPIHSYEMLAAAALLIIQGLRLRERQRNQTFQPTQQPAE